MCDHEDREAAMVTIKRDAEGKPTIWCDPCLVPLVRALNKGGLTTIASCCGHGTQPGRISLADGTDLTITGTCEACGGQGTYYGCLWCDDTGEGPRKSWVEDVVDTLAPRYIDSPEATHIGRPSSPPDDEGYLENWVDS